MTFEPEPYSSYTMYPTSTDKVPTFNFINDPSNEYAEENMISYESIYYGDNETDPDLYSIDYEIVVEHMEEYKQNNLISGNVYPTKIVILAQYPVASSLVVYYSYKYIYDELYYKKQIILPYGESMVDALNEGINNQIDPNSITVTEVYLKTNENTSVDNTYNYIW